MTFALISVAAVPDLPADGEVIVGAADALIVEAGQVTEHIDAAAMQWTTLDAVFDTPDTPTLLAAWAPVTAAAEDFQGTAAAAGRALADLGDTLILLAMSRQRLIEDITTHRARVLAYRSDYPAADTDTSLLTEWGPGGGAEDAELRDSCHALRRHFDDALDTCEAALRRIPDGYGFAPVTMAGASPPATMSFAGYEERFTTGLSLAILDRLAAQPDDIARLLRDNPGWAGQLEDHPPAPEAAAAWWAGLSTTDTSGWSPAQAGLLGGAAAIIGGLGGIPYTARDVANRTVLAERIRELENAPATRSPGRNDPCYLRQIDFALQDNPTAQLAELDITHAPPAAAVSIGNLDTADHVAYQAYGMLSSTADMGDATATALRTSREMEILSTQQGDSVSAAVVAWFGYTGPNLAEEPYPFSAAAGAERLGESLAAFEAVRSNTGPDAYLTVNAHSYAGIVVTEALAHDDYGVDQVVLYGTPGVYVPHAVDLADPADDVWAARADDDSVASFWGRDVGDVIGTRWRHDPVDADWGAHEFGVAGNQVDPVTGRLMDPSTGHEEYLLPDTESLRNIAVLNLGDDDLVTTDR